ncbi:MAG: hypothetical protein HY401_02440 [Elusimicrobia bacterium]|nr:hypothetical protein [Elusimicrobiota bacterium]
MKILLRKIFDARCSMLDAGKNKRKKSIFRTSIQHLASSIFLLGIQQPASPSGSEARGG